MSPLIDGENTFQDEECYPLNWWKKKFGFGSYSTVAGAATRSGVTIDRAKPRYPNQPRQLMLSISDTPKILKGFQLTAKRPDGYHFHEWSLEINPEADVIEFTPPSGKKLIYKKN